MKNKNKKHEITAKIILIEFASVDKLCIEVNGTNVLTIPISDEDSKILKDLTGIEPIERYNYGTF